LKPGAFKRWVNWIQLVQPHRVLRQQLQSLEASLAGDLRVHVRERASAVCRFVSGRRVGEKEGKSCDATVFQKEDYFFSPEGRGKCVHRQAQGKKQYTPTHRCRNGSHARTARRIRRRCRGGAGRLESWLFDAGCCCEVKVTVMEKISSGGGGSATTTTPTSTPTSPSAPRRTSAAPAIFFLPFLPFFAKRRQRVVCVRKVCQLLLQGCQP
jgi:hypothetical protein